MDFAGIRDRAATLPTDPGVYLFRDGGTAATDTQSVADIGDADGRVLYVGKAVNLRDRVRSYTDPRSERIAQMVKRATTIEVAITETETQALLLEANLIKRYAPRYNVRLKDDKSYPFVQLTAHEVPRIEITRNPSEGGSVYGPFTNRSDLETVVKAIRDIYGIRGCSDAKFSNRDRPCLDYELGICTAPCTGEISVDAYQSDVDAVRRFFGGETGTLTGPLREAMEAAAESQSFERAATLRDRLQVVTDFHTDGEDAVRAPDESRTIDVLGVAIDGETATVARLHSEDGQLVDRDRHALVAPQGGADRSVKVLAAFIQQYYAERSFPDHLLVPERPDDQDLLDWLTSAGVSLQVPGAGRESRMVELAMKNARQGTMRDSASAELASELGIDTVSRIEGFDISHTGGADVVGSNVTFEGDDRDPSGYRRKRLSEENDDYANMHRLIEWRASRAVEGRDDRPDPDLLLIDGGSGQLAAAQEALDAVGWDCHAIAIAKGDDGDRILDGDGPINISDTARSLLQQVRDEAHRFAVQYHESLRDEVSTPLDGIPGVGPALRQRLLQRFGGVDRIRTASMAELRDIEGIGPETAREITERL